MAVFEVTPPAHHEKPPPQHGCDLVLAIFAAGCAHELVGSGTLLAALSAIESDGTYLDRVVAGVLRHGRLGNGKTSRQVDNLSLREGDVLRGICKGMSNQNIADELYLSIDTVKSHVHNLLQKLPARDRTHAVVVAFRDGLVELPQRLPRWQ